MTLIARIRLTRWADKSLTGEVPVGRDQYGQPVWARISGAGIGIILGTVKGADWECWKETIKVDGKAQDVTRYRTARSWRMESDDRVVGRVDVISVKPEDVPTEEATKALEGAGTIAKPTPRARAAEAPAVDIAG